MKLILTHKYLLMLDYITDNNDEFKATRPSLPVFCVFLAYECEHRLPGALDVFHNRCPLPVALYIALPHLVHCLRHTTCNAVNSHLLLLCLLYEQPF